MTELPTRLWQSRGGGMKVSSAHPYVASASAVEVIEHICSALAESAQRHGVPPLQIDQWEVAFSIDALPVVRERHPGLLRLTELAGVKVIYPERPAVRSMAMTATAWATCRCSPGFTVAPVEHVDYSGHWLWLQAELGFTDDEPGITPLVDVRMDDSATHIFHYSGDTE